MIEKGVRVWKGIPYAQPPVGELRWRPPVAPLPWTGLRDATEYGNVGPQMDYSEQSIYELPPQKRSEDCLYLNVWAPHVQSDDKLPVFVWIHGGSLTREGGTHPQYLGHNMAKKGIIYVSINYRLNAFGFLAHPELSKENEQKISGNYGIMDQIAALEWIQENIAAFGGDPENVTIAGESAGAWSVTLLTATQKAKGLFQKAIAQSGAYLWRGPHLKQASNGYISGEDEGEKFMGMLGATTAQELRNVPVDSIVKLFFSSQNMLSSEPLVDGYLFTEDIVDTYNNGSQNKVDVISGANSDEYSLWVPELPTDVNTYKEQVETQYPGRSHLFFIAYPVTDSSSIAESYVNFRGDRSFLLRNRQWAEKMESAGNNVYLYYFSKTPSERYPEKYGAFHGAEIVYALDNLQNDPGPIGSGTISEADLAYASLVSDYWVNFTKTGNPNGENTSIVWPKWSNSDQAYIEFGEDISAGNHLLKERLDALQNFLDAEKKEE